MLISQLNDGNANAVVVVVDFALIHASIVRLKAPLDPLKF
jgi:hypothetical protein